jgi:anti-anti-sigma factor
MSGGSEFEIRNEPGQSATVIVARGELDHGSAQALDRLLWDPKSKASTVVLDLREVTFIDSAGLSVIVAQHRRAKEEQFRFVIAAGGARGVQRLFELSGLHGILALAEDPDSALVD